MSTTVFYYDSYFPNKLLTYKEFKRIKAIKLKNRQLKNQGWKYAGSYSATYSITY